MPSVAFIAIGGGPQVNQVVRYLRHTLGASSVDLTNSPNLSVLREARAAQGVFIVSSTDRVSLELAHERASWLRSAGLEDKCGLILWRSPRGVSAADAEEMVGLPVCGLLKGEQETDALARWIAAEQGIEGVHSGLIQQALAAVEAAA